MAGNDVSDMMKGGEFLNQLTGYETQDEHCAMS
jgi:hypothetical protein